MVSATSVATVHFRRRSAASALPTHTHNKTSGLCMCHSAYIGRGAEFGGPEYAFEGYAPSPLHAHTPPHTPGGVCDGDGQLECVVLLPHLPLRLKLRLLQCLGDCVVRGQGLDTSEDDSIACCHQLFAVISELKQSRRHSGVVSTIIILTPCALTTCPNSTPLLAALKRPRCIAVVM
jgi:hypothetical protein